MTEVTTHYWTASDGVELAWRECGQGRPIILLHGLFSDAQMNWIKFGHAERIAREGFRVIMPDLRAHGLSAKPHGEQFYPKGILARDLRELIARLALAEFDLGGFSLGARTTVEGVGAIDLVTKAMGSDLQARLADLPIHTPGAAKASQLVDRTGIVVPVCSIQLATQALAGAPIRVLS